MANIIIVGGGVTGLSTGIHLALSGMHRVTICEAHNVPGGNLTGWDRQGYYIDNCMHWLNGTNPSTKLYQEWCQLGALGHVDILHPTSLFTCRQGTESITLWRNLERTRRDMTVLSPEDITEINRLFRAVAVVQNWKGIAPRQHGRKESTAGTLLSMPDILRYFRMSTKELASRFKHPLLAQFMNAMCGDCFTAMAMILVMADFGAGNADLPAGGSRAMALRIADRFRSLGGQLRLSQAVTSVTLGGEWTGRQATSVTLSGGSKIPADYVIITADPRRICGKILQAPMPPALARKYRDADSIRFSAFHAAFSCPTEAVGFTDDLIVPIPPEEVPVLGEGQVIFRTFSHEPSFAPKGHTVVQAMVFCPEKTARSFILLAHDRKGYTESKQAIADSFIRLLSAVCPTSEGHVKLLDVWTPATYRKYVGSEIGSFMSFVSRPGVLPRSLSGKIPGVENVVLAGQWLYSPGGLPIAAMQGKRAAETALHDLKKQASPLHRPDRIRVSFG